MTRPLTCLSVALAIALCAAPVAAQGTGVALGGFRADPTAPVEVAADSLDMTQAEGRALFSGDVRVTRGDMVLTAGSILVEYDRLPDGSLGQTVARITAEGGVMLVTPDEAAEARVAIYEPGTSTVVMTGDVVLTQGPNTLAGSKLTVDLTTGVGQVEGRVRTILQSAPADPAQ